MSKESSLKKFKKEFAKLQKKYKLPDFKELNENFYIEKAAEAETDYLIREIRKFLADKFSNYLRFTEALLHPTNVPIFVFSVIKSIGSEEKKTLGEIYKKLAKIEVELIKLDIEFSEKKEAEFIKDSYKIWKDIRKDLVDILEIVQNSWDNKFETNGKGYFG